MIKLLQKILKCRQSIEVELTDNLEKILLLENNEAEVRNNKFESKDKDKASSNNTKLEESCNYLNYSKDLEESYINKARKEYKANGIYLIARYVYCEEADRLIGLCYLNNTLESITFKNKRYKVGDVIFVDACDYDKFVNELGRLIRRQYKGEVIGVQKSNGLVIKSRFRNSFDIMMAYLIKIEVCKVYTKRDINGKQMAMGYQIRNLSNHYSMTIYSYSYSTELEELKETLREGQEGILNDALLEKFVQENGLYKSLKSGKKVSLGKAYLKYREDLDEITLAIPEKYRADLIEVLVDCQDGKYAVTDKQLLKKHFGNEFETIERDKQYKVIGKMACKKETKYILLSIEGENKVVTQLELLKICREKNIINCRAIENKSGKYRFVGVGMNFERLPTVTEGEYNKIKWEMLTNSDDKLLIRDAGIKAEGKVAVQNFMTNYHKEKLGIQIVSKQDFEKKKLENKSDLA